MELSDGRGRSRPPSGQPRFRPGPIYDHYAGVITPRPNVGTMINPIIERQALSHTISKLRSAALSAAASPRGREDETVAYTLAAEEAQKAAKLAAERALDRRRHEVVVSIYSLVPSHRTLLTAARRKKQEVVIPPAPQQVAAAAAAQAAAKGGWAQGGHGRTSHGRLRPSSAPMTALDLRAGGSSGKLRGQPRASAHAAGRDRGGAGLSTA